MYVFASEDIIIITDLIKDNIFVKSVLLKPLLKQVNKRYILSNV